MPVTAELSGKSYEKFGDDIANELVDWFTRPLDHRGRCVSAGLGALAA
jgi:hypothetical protein